MHGGRGGLLFSVAGISACSVIRALSHRVALSATLCHPPSLPPLPCCLQVLAKALSSPTAWTAISLYLAGPLCL